MERIVGQAIGISAGGIYRVLSLRCFGLTSPCLRRRWIISFCVSCVRAHHSLERFVHALHDGVFAFGLVLLVGFTHAPAALAI